ncbi:MAG: anthranilate phosphoribosyltransferase [Nitrosopumilaceae archaeon]|nr:anthranilate phosphoribosyltransferase [Nitrosopumilaceae archaeon]NIU02623.1 anthranilate phosphoribosyltransferase [Nitrosopumilaceae archaeon]NIU89086.1 anthranilate phosphoribosyltransferase [Nitrosopumilaceae archaeon]NIV67189.1 anthranilate phosphoribosyltransferase [Nitrosopumilaceae archaeon]NIX63224.1 anthranilate phosphoribosyltransferase [Nitrosopumilaceae archaeon]
MIKDMILELEHKNDLTYNNMSLIMDNIFRGKFSDNEIADFLKKLTEKGETDDEILGMLDKMDERSLHINPDINDTIIDVCGTGGDNMQTFNVSTTASFVIAAAGGHVAKHGNRSVSGICGSADIFESLGYDLESSPEKVASILKKHRICFLFAQKFHPSMRMVSKARKIVGKKTIFNLLGPLTNPSNVKNQVIGVYSEIFIDRLPRILQKRNFENVMCVRAENGMDEFSTNVKNKVSFLHENKIKSMVVDPQNYGLTKSSLDQIQVSTFEQAISSFVSVLKGTANRSMIETTALNAAAGLIVANKAESFSEGIELSLKTIESGRSFQLLQDFVKDCGDLNKFEEIDQ